MMLDHERLTKRRESIARAIESLQRGMAKQRRKIGEYTLAIGSGTFDDDAMRTEIEKMEANNKMIERTLTGEKDKLAAVDKQLAASAEILDAHGTTPCLLGAAPHTWVVLETFPRSGNFKRRRCSVCDAEQRIG